MQARFASLKVVSYVLKGLAVVFAMIASGAALVTFADVLQYIDPYYGDISYWIGDLIAPMVGGVVGLVLAAFIWALADVLVLLLAIEENTRPPVAQTAEQH